MKEKCTDLPNGGAEPANESKDQPLMLTLIKLALPLLMGYMMVLINTIIDTVFISMIDRHSSALMSGVGLIIPIYMCFLAIGNGLYIGIRALVARGIDEANDGLLKKSIGAGLRLSIICSVTAFIVFMAIGKPLVYLLAGKALTPAAVNSAIQYYFGFIPGCCLLLVFYTFLGIFIGAGSRQDYGKSVLLCLISNIILDPIFIFGFKMGVSGAALASSLSMLFSLVFSVSIFWRKKTKISLDFHIKNADQGFAGEIIRIGAPQALSMIITSVGLIMINHLMGSFSQNTMNSWILVGRSDEFLLLVGYAFGGAVTTLVEQYYTENNWAKVREVYKVNMALGLGVGCIFAIIYNLLARNWFSMFTSLPDVVENCVTQVGIISFTQLGLNAAVITYCSFQAIGHKFPGLVVEIVKTGLVAIPLVFSLVYLFNAGAREVFYAIGVSNLVAMVVSLAWWYCFLRKVTYQKTDLPSREKEMGTRL